MNAFLMPENSKFRTVFVPFEPLQSTPNSNSSLQMMQNSVGGQTILLSVAEAQKLQLGQTYASVRQITEACTAIYKTQFGVITPKPSWYDSLNGRLQIARDYARIWLEDYAIAVTSTIPTSIITFTPTFDSSAKVIKYITDTTKGDLSPSDLATARDVLTRLATKADEILDTVKVYVYEENNLSSGKLVTWQSDMRKIGLDLKIGTESVQEAATDLSANIKEYNGKISVLQKEIDAYNILVATGGGLVGVGAVVGSIGYGVFFAFPVAGIITMVCGLGMIIAGATVLGVYQAKISQANRDIIDFQRKISASNQTMVALNGLSTGLDTVVRSADSAVGNLSDFAGSWLTFSKNIKATIQALDEGKSDTKGILLAMDMNTAAENWKDAKNYAQGLMNVPTTMKEVSPEQIA